MGWSEEFRFRQCGWCGVRDVAMTKVTNYLDAQKADGISRHWVALTCPRCGGATVIETNEHRELPHRALTVLPEAEADVNLGVSHLPDDVQEYFRDSVRAMQADLPDAAAVQMRRTLEAAAAHFDDEEGNRIDNGPLVQRIQRLVAAGLLTSQFGDAVHHVRQLGNLGAHAGDVRLNEAQARRALSFTTQTLRNLFEIPGELQAVDPADNEDE